jgi:putative phosphoribosyl transferase
MPPFVNRQQAGTLLAQLVNPEDLSPPGLVLALPRGGVPVAFPLAQHLSWPLELALVRKLGVPQQPELAFGAIALGGIQILNPDIIRLCHLAPEAMDQVINTEKQELERRRHKYLGQRTPLSWRGQTLLLVDDGVATGATLKAAIALAQNQKPQKLIVAVPVMAQKTAAAIAPLVAQLVVLETPLNLNNIGQWYQDFSQVEDEEVSHLMSLPTRLD